MPSKFTQAKWLASSLLTGAWERHAIADRLTRALPDTVQDVAALATHIRFHFDAETPPDPMALALLLLDEPVLKPVFESGAIRSLLLDRHVMTQRPDALAILPLPELPTLQDIGLWLCLSDEEVSWFADTRRRQGKVTDAKLHHYRYSWIPKRAGGFRLIEAPKSRLKEIQRMIVKDILGRLPPHECAHGFTRGRSIKTYVGQHIKQQVVLRLDLKDFFHSVPLPRVTALFRRLGYPPHVAHVLQGFCVNAVAPSLAGDHFAKLPWHDKNRLRNRHLPQGAPTSAPLANLCAWNLDCRLKGLADRYGYQYSRYADDLAFSGPSSLARRAKFIEALVAAIAQEEGFSINHRKTRLRLASQRQRLAGVVINEKANYSRAEWDRLKALLHNCIKHGPASQNRDSYPDFRAHLAGRVAHISWLNPARGEKLQSLLHKIAF